MSNERTGIETSVEVITPAMAREWLGHNTQNRNLKVAKVTQYSRDMREGKWQLTGESIKFAKDGTLLDGQNRLHACIDADQEFETFVVRGLEAAAQEVMDSGAPRMASDTLKLRGYDNTNSLAAVIGAHAGWRYGMFQHCMSQPQGRDRLTTSEIVDHVVEFPGLVEACRMGATIKRIVYLPVGSLGCAIHETSLVDADAASEFFGRLGRFETRGASDPVATLLRRTALMRERRQPVLTATGLYLLFRTWNGVRRGEELSRFLLGSEDRGWATIPDPV